MLFPMYYVNKFLRKLKSLITKVIEATDTNQWEARTRKALTKLFEFGTHCFYIKFFDIDGQPLNAYMYQFP